MIFSCFKKKLKKNVGGLLGGGAKDMLASSQIIGGGEGGWPPGPLLPTPMPQFAISIKCGINIRILYRRYIDPKHRRTYPGKATISRHSLHKL